MSMMAHFHLRRPRRRSEVLHDKYPGSANGGPFETVRVVHDDCELILFVEEGCGDALVDAFKRAMPPKLGDA